MKEKPCATCNVTDLCHEVQNYVGVDACAADNADVARVINEIALAERKKRDDFLLEKVRKEIDGQRN